ncbi:hypothetical protein [Desulfosarcina variabilis]
MSTGSDDENIAALTALGRSSVAVVLVNARYCLLTIDQTWPAQIPVLC